MPYLTTRKKNQKATTKPWFSRLLRHPARKRSGSILSGTQHTPRTHTGVGEWTYVSDLNTEWLYRSLATSVKSENVNDWPMELLDDIVTSRPELQILCTSLPSTCAVNAGQSPVLTCAKSVPLHSAISSFLALRDTRSAGKWHFETNLWQL